MDFKIFEFGNYENYNKCCKWLKEKEIHFFKHSQYINILILQDELDLLNDNELDTFYNEILE